MPNTVLVGAQWGDEGKGKVIDVLAREVDIVVRFQGGNNAGHTVKVGNDKGTLLSVMTQLLPYLGYPRTLNALRCLNETLPESK